MIICRKKKKLQQPITIRGTEQLKTTGGKQGGEELLMPLVMPGMTAVMVSAGLDDLPAYINCDSIKKSLLRQNQISITQAHLNQLKGHVSNSYYMGRYDTAFKAATFAMKPKPDVQNVGKHRGGIRSIVKQINNEMLSSPNNCKLKKSMVYNAVQRGEYSVSPLKNGRQVIVPSELTHGIACYILMMQATGKGEASSLQMRAMAKGVTLGTPFENKFSINYLWKKMRVDRPCLILPAKAVNNKDWHVDWLIFKNIIDCIKATK